MNCKCFLFLYYQMYKDAPGTPCTTLHEPQVTVMPPLLCSQMQTDTSTPQVLLIL